MPDKMKMAAELFGNAVIIFFFVMLFYYGIEHVQDELFMGIRSTSMGIPRWRYTIGMPIGSVIIIIRVLQRSYRVVKGEDN